MTESTAAGVNLYEEGAGLFGALKLDEMVSTAKAAELLTPAFWLRITYYDIAKDRFRWKADVSNDGGKTWTADQIRIEAKRAS